MAAARPPLLTPRFLILCATHFAASTASFQLFPAMPFRIRELGGSTAASGLFLGMLTYASALSAPWTGTVNDLLGRRRVLVHAGLALAVCGILYAIVPYWPLLVLIALPHGIIWSSLLTASAAYASDLIPAERRGEGIAYHGMAPTLAVAVAPSLGFWLAGHGWIWLCASIVVLDLAVAVFAWKLTETVPAGRLAELRGLSWDVVDWSTLGLSGTLFLAAFGYGGMTSFVAQLAEARGIAPKGLFFSVFAATILISRPLLGRMIDDFGPRRAIPVCAVAIAVGLGLLPAASTRTEMVVAAILFGAGFSTFYPAFSALVLSHADPRRRGAAFGAMLAAFDTGIGSGSIAFGWGIERFGFAAAFGGAGLLALAAWPYFILAERRARGARRPTDG